MRKSHSNIMREEAVGRYRRDLPEYAYELSFRDLVELPAIVSSMQKARERGRDSFGGFWIGEEKTKTRKSAEFGVPPFPPPPLFHSLFLHRTTILLVGAVCRSRRRPSTRRRHLPGAERLPRAPPRPALRPLPLPRPLRPPPLPPPPLPSLRLFLLLLNPNPNPNPNPNSDPNSDSISPLLGVVVSSLASAKLFPLLWSLLLDLRASPSPPTFAPELFWLLFRAYARARRPDDALRAFRRMPDFVGLPHSLPDLHRLLSALSNHSLVAHALPFFRSLRSRFPVTPQTYTILISGWARLRDPANARALFDEMLQRGLAPDAPSYSALIAALCAAGELGAARDRLREMQRRHGLTPDAATYSPFVRAACSAKDARSALRALDSMRRRGLAPNVFTYNAVVKLLCESGELGDAYELLDEMLARGAKPDTWGYNAILAAHCRLREANKALRLIARMDRDSCSPDRHTYNMLLKMLIGVGRIDRAAEVWDGMEKRGFHPAAASYAVMIHGLCRTKGRVEDACAYFERMVDEGIPPYLSTCELVREKLLKLGLRERVGALAGKMRRSTSCTIQELAAAMQGSKRTECNSEKESRIATEEWSRTHTDHKQVLS
ncbi:Pentatricopeptide repeat-containing protein, mitochondrial [Ananas comosus]|uniref:Pentatricopeptide repeat-containing protein, mitochondrial n=1 Tax=Ananas comosus TaxID=4615 RepID=A0A199W213_ANACO|nr:Pentatricopeptide repeat-containing protein, mitochondrial [Ananas comosus]